MALKKYTIEVTRVDEYEIEIDDSIYTDEFIEQWSESFFDSEEDNRQEDFVKHLATGLTSGGIMKGIEGFGYVKQKYESDEDPDLLPQYSSASKRITEEEYSPGLFVKIRQYDTDYETEVITNNK